MTSPDNRPKRVKKPLTAEQKKKQAESQLRYYARNKEAVRARKKAWRDNRGKAYFAEYGRKNREKLKAMRAAWIQENLLHHRHTQWKSRIWQKFKLTESDYFQMLSAQGHVCAICKTFPASKHISKLDVDHCHTTGRIRGLLCRTCNAGIGQLKDSIPNLEAAIQYLRGSYE